MNDYEPNDNYSLLNEEKKLKIMKELRKDINKQKEEYSINGQNFNDINNNNYNYQNINNSNFKNDKYRIDENLKDKYQLNNNIINRNELEERGSNIYKESEEENNEEEHFLILNNAKSVLNQIQDDINKFSKIYGLENISEKNKDNKGNINAYNPYNNLKYNKDSNKILIDNNDYDEISSSNDNNNDYNNKNYENINYDNNYEDYNDEEENNMDYNSKNNDQGYKDQINGDENDNKAILKRKRNINDNNEYKIDQRNVLFEDIENEVEKKNFDLEESPKKFEYFNDIKDYNFNSNNISTITQNYSKLKYNFENPLNYDKEKINNNYIKYSNNINKEVNNYELNKKENNKKSKSITKNKNNNINNIEYIDKESNKTINESKTYNKSHDKTFILKNKEKFETLKKELENKFANEHPFKPKINKKYYKKNEETEEERINRLSRPKILDINEIKRKKELEESKKVEEKNEMRNINKINPKEVCNRLYNLHQEMKIKKDKIKQKYEENQNKEYSFTPEINVYSKILMDKYEKKSIYERNEEFQKQKDENIIRKRQELEKDQKERCKPLINEKSRKIALINRNNNRKDNDEQYDENVYERLYRENNNNNKDIKLLANREMKECTFSPKLNPISEYLMNNNSNIFDEEDNNENDNMKDFLERQKIYEEIKKEKLEKNIINNKIKYTFKPEINLNSNLLVKCNPERYAEKNNDKYIRLYQEAQKIKIKKEKLENELNNKYDFTPKINELSKYIGRKTDINKLNYQDNKDIEKKIKKEEEEYDFKPQLINNNYKNIKSNYKNDENILERINEEMKNRNGRIKMMQMIKENNDIEKYNFTPEINKKIPDFENNKPIYMKGMARYLNQMEKARKAKRDKEEREKEVFLTGEGWNKNNGITVPKPFKLSYQNNQKNKNKNEKEDKKELNSKINENKNREIIKKLLITN